MTEKKITSIQAVRRSDGKKFTWSTFASADMLRRIKMSREGLKVTHINGAPVGPRKGESK